MKLILMRHEEKTNGIGFFLNLTEQGLYNAEFIIPKKINNITSKVDYIFSSPYYRKLQTIQFYSKMNNCKVNVENSLCEYVNNTYFIYNKWKYNQNEINNPGYNDIKKIFNNNYKSLINIEEINNNKKYILETEEQFKNRIISFINYLKKNYDDNSTIIVVTHMHVVNMLYYLYNNDNSQNETILEHSDFGKIFVVNI